MPRMVPGGPHTAPWMVQGTNYSATDGPGPLLGGGDHLWCDSNATSARSSNTTNLRLRISRIIASEKAPQFVMLGVPYARTCRNKSYH